VLRGATKQHICLKMCSRRLPLPTWSRFKRNYWCFIIRHKDIYLSDKTIVKVFIAEFTRFYGRQVSWPTVWWVKWEKRNQPLLYDDDISTNTIQPRRQLFICHSCQGMGHIKRICNRTGRCPYNPNTTCQISSQGIVR